MILIRWQVFVTPAATENRKARTSAVTLEPPLPRVITTMDHTGFVRGTSFRVIDDIAASAPFRGSDEYAANIFEVIFR
jgi:hypothetical protein